MARVMGLGEGDGTTVPKLETLTRTTFGRWLWGMRFKAWCSKCSGARAHFTTCACDTVCDTVYQYAFGGHHREDKHTSLRAGDGV